MSAREPIRLADDGTYYDRHGRVVEDPAGLEVWNPSQDPGKRPIHLRAMWVGAGSSAVDPVLQRRAAESCARQDAEWKTRHELHEAWKHDQCELEKDRDATRLARAFGDEGERRGLWERVRDAIGRGSRRGRPRKDVTEERARADADLLRAANPKMEDADLIALLAAHHNVQIDTIKRRLGLRL